MRPYARAAVEASLLPHLNTLRSLGVRWIPGLMAGMVLSGSDPVYAAGYQFAVIALILAAGGLTSLAGVLFARPRFFSGAEQLLVRPARKQGSGDGPTCPIRRDMRSRGPSILYIMDR